MTSETVFYPQKLGAIRLGREPLCVTIALSQGICNAVADVVTYWVSIDINVMRNPHASSGPSNGKMSFFTSMLSMEPLELSASNRMDDAKMD